MGIMNLHHENETDNKPRQYIPHQAIENKPEQPDLRVALVIRYTNSWAFPLEYVKLRKAKFSQLNETNLRSINNGDHRDRANHHADEPHQL